MVDVLDYSSGYPAPAAVKAKYGGIVRYAGTPGRGKNLTRVEAQAMLAAHVPIGLVYEAGAGWMLGGAAVGAGAARAVLADAAQCGVGVRCVYFAADFDVTDAQQMQAVERTLDGAASVLGRARTGVYGEADVIDACLSAGHAVWGWQTRAWSGGRVSTRAHLLQQVGYVDVGGVQCDRSTVLKPDWGYWPMEDDMPLDAADLDAIAAKLAGDKNRYLLAVRQELITALADPTHLYLQDELAPLKDALTAAAGRDVALAAAVHGLATVIAAGTNGLTVEDVKAAVAAAISEGLVHVDISVLGQATPPASA